MLTGVIGLYLLWSIPVGALLGTMLTYALLRLPRRFTARKEFTQTWLSAMGLGIVAAPMAPGFLGLGPQTTTQLWQGFALEYSMAWLGLCVIAQLERRSHI